jgi:1,2-diacylglycerol 3-beta-galactosyltransferase
LNNANKVHRHMSDIKRILILTSSAGFGHISAARAIRIAFDDLYPGRTSILFSNPLEDKTVPPLLGGRQFDYDQVVRAFPKLHEFIYWLTNQAIPSSAYQSWMATVCYGILGGTISQFKPDAIVLTYFGYHSALNRLFSKQIKKIPVFTVVTDLANVHRLWFHPVTDFCLVPSVSVQQQALTHHVRNERIRITGIPVNPRLGDKYPSPAALRQELRWETNLKTILVVGSKRVRKLRSYIDAINQLHLPIQLVVVSGGDEDLYRYLENKTWNVKIHLYHFVENITEYIRASDMVISKAGGLIVSEALAGGLPLLLIDALPGQETGNVKFVLEAEAGEFADTPEKAVVILNQWLRKDSVELNLKATNARRVGLPEAAYVVARLIWSIIEKDEWRHQTW